MSTIGHCIEPYGVFNNLSWCWHMVYLRFSYQVVHCRKPWFMKRNDFWKVIN